MSGQSPFDPPTPGIPGQLPGHGQPPGQSDPGYQPPPTTPPYHHTGHSGHNTGWPQQPGAQYQPPSQSGRPPNKSKAPMILLGVGIALVVLVVGACVVGAIVIYANDASREFVSELTIDFSDGVPAAQAATCEVAGLDFADDYEVFATVTNVSDVESHYLIDYELFDATGASLGTDFGIVSNLAPGASERDDTEGVIDGATPWADVECEVLATTRVAASG